MNLLTKQVYGNKAVVGFNTYIGGVSATISTASALATKLAISVGRISNFTIVGSDIQCLITGSYLLYNAFSYDDTNQPTYYRDLDGLANLGALAFYNTTLVEGIFPNATSIGASAFDQNISVKNTLKLLYIPNVTSITANSFRSGNLGGGTIYCHPSLATSNGGAEDATIAYLRTGNTIRYVTNFTAPNPVTILSAGTVYNTAIQLNFTAPTGSTNAIDYYECYANGVFKNNITASGGYITGLTPSTSYVIEVKPVDIFYNKSTSNTVTQSTNTTSALPTTGLVSYYKLDSNSNDSFGSNNGTDTAVSYVSGKISNAGSYNGSTSKTIIGNPANLQLSTGSISCWIKTSGAGNSDRAIFGKAQAYTMFLRDNVLGIYNWGSYGGSGFKSTGVNLADNQWHHIVFAFESGTANNKLYIDGVLKLTFSMSVSNQTDNVMIGWSWGPQFFTGQIDEASIHNIALTQTDIDQLYNGGNGITL